jgi:hypothetical protein
MTGPAQHHFIIGTMCIDEEFRNAVFAEGITEQSLRELLKTYGTKYQVVLDDGNLVNDMLSFVKGPCRGAALEKMADLKAAACPCWPC